MNKNYTVFVVAALLGVMGSAAQAQYTNPYTGNIFNNPMSSFLDTVIMNQRNANMMHGALNSSMAASLAAERARIKKSGEEKIKRGQATTRFSPVKRFHREEWITRCGGKTPPTRQQIGEELTVQQAIWAEEVRSRSADVSDVAQMLGVAFVLAWEPHSGEKANVAQYRWIVADFRRSLLKDPHFQGMSAAAKQYLVESNLVSSSDTVRLWRLGRTEGDATLEQSGRTAAGRFLAGWWEGPVENLVATPTGFKDKKP